MNPKVIIQKLSKEKFIYGKDNPMKDVKVFYISECFRPQNGRYRQFTQFGVEIINPSKDYSKYLINLSKIVRGLGYYKDSKGFEVSCPSLGAQKQICGGGEYDGGSGFAIGIDRLIIIDCKKDLT